jgi:hypothetical protein
MYKVFTLGLLLLGGCGLPKTEVRPSLPQPKKRLDPATSEGAGLTRDEVVAEIQKFYTWLRMTKQLMGKVPHPNPPLPRELDPVTLEPIEHPAQTVDPVLRFNKLMKENPKFEKAWKSGREKT